MEARIISPAELTDGEIGLWRELQSADRTLRSPFLSPEFTIAIGAARRDAAVAILRQRGRIVGFLPFHRAAGNVGKPIGGPIADYQGPILRPDARLDAQALLSACKLETYDFNHAPVTIEALSKGAVHFSQSPYIDLGDGHAAWLAGRVKASKDAIRSIERRRRKIEREIGPLLFEWHDASPVAWDWLVETKSAFYRRIGVASGFDVPWVARALDAIRTRQDPDFAGLMHTLHAGDRLIAAQFGMRAADTLCWWYTTYDDELRNLGPGLVLLLAAVERAEAEGVVLIDFGRGDEPYKLAYANGATPLCEGSIERGASVPGALRRTQKAALRALSRLPLGRYESIPRRAMARLLTGMHLPPEPS
jgi:CelD/BcsL family acetyltransferase involved in cellulose biosynthesis